MVKKLVILGLKKGCRSQLCHQFLTVLVPSKSRCGNVTNKLEHKVELPFVTTIVVITNIQHVEQIAESATIMCMQSNK